MSKEQENLRQEFIDETKAKLWAEDINEDVGFSDKYVEWLEAKQLILSGVSGSFSQNDMENFAAKCMILGSNSKDIKELLKGFCDNDH